MRLVAWQSAVRRAFTLTVLCAACLIVGRPPLVRAAASSTSELHGLWVVRTALTSRDDIATVVRAAERGGFNALFVQVRGRGDAFYKSAIEPRSSELDSKPADFDPLAVTLELAHRAGIRVHAWIAVNLVASAVTLPRAPAHVINRHPEWLMVPSALTKSLQGLAPSSPAYRARLAEWTRQASDQVEGLFLSPISPAARQYTVSVVKDLVSRYAVDGVHFDYVRYPGDNFDYSKGSLAAFRAVQVDFVTAAARQRLDEKARTSPAAWAAAFPEAWEGFRRERLTWLVHAMAAAVRSARPAASVTAAVFPRAEEARTHRLQDWPRWAASGELDAVCPMAYVTDEGEFRSLIERARQSAGRTPIWAGIGAFKLPPSDAAAQVKVARGAGAAGMMIFSFESVGSQSEYLDSLRAAFAGRQP